MSLPAGARPVAPAPADLAERLAINSVGSFDWDLDQGRFDLDRTGLDVFDFRPGEFDGRPESLVLRIAPEESARIGAALRRALESGEPGYGGYFQVTRRDGAKQLTHTQGTILRDRRGNAYRVVGIVRDASRELVDLPPLSWPGDDTTGRRTLASVLRSTTEAVSSALTVEDVKAVLTGAGGLERFGADGLALGLVESGSLKFVAAGGPSVETIEGVAPSSLLESLPLAESVLTQQPRYSSDYPDLEERFPLLVSYLRGIGMASVAFLPLIAQARSIGGLALFYREHKTFGQEDRELAGALAGILAQSLQRAILFDQEREFATALQASMLPRHLPRFESADIAVRYHAARSGREVGGDWYDVVALPRNRVGLVIGDVQGHDTHAAAIMGQLRIALRAYAAEGHPPATVLARASRFLAELDTDRFATCAYAQLDLESGTVWAARAGHLGPLVRHTDGRTGWPHVRGGVPLGVATTFEQLGFPETRVDLVPGESFVFCTDGLVEERGLDITIGMESLAETVGHGPPGAEELADHIAESLWTRWGSEDDVALLVLRRAPDNGSACVPRIHQYVHQADPEGLVEARVALRQALDDWGLSTLADDVEAAAGELLVNVLLHTDGGAVLTLEVVPASAGRVRLSVQDRSSVPLRRRSPGEAATSGRGLMMIDAMAARWGVEPRGDGKAVWCEFGSATGETDRAGEAARAGKAAEAAEPDEAGEEAAGPA
ncbi:SpoIIE family protein phosphatase [Streptomyces sp. NBC_01190]|uniref:SpoIIE family protein phosphatase n=1 Tax=Streptomyces sp. NBC_01190 TaxID=2903767 RepID=UPI00386CDBA6|nr:SpoIIE family protein phosphatase [Streptomyces sp. NBC_01190]